MRIMDIRLEKFDPLMSLKLQLWSGKKFDKNGSQ